MVLELVHMMRGSNRQQVGTCELSARCNHPDCFINGSSLLQKLDAHFLASGAKKAELIGRLFYSFVICLPPSGRRAAAFVRSLQTVAPFKSLYLSSLCSCFPNKGLQTFLRSSLILSLESATTPKSAL